jgi:tryptophan-rich sensory protein
VSRENDPEWDGDSKRLRRIERKIDIAAEIAAFISAIWAADSVIRYIPTDWDAPSWVIGILWFVVFAVFGACVWRTWLKL